MKQMAQGISNLQRSELRTHFHLTIFRTCYQGFPIISFNAELSDVLVNETVVSDFDQILHSDNATDARSCNSSGGRL